MAGLPDPSVDLDWSGYLGSISDHFAKNAKDFPDRTCVVETKSSKTPERRFTYRQIFDASNVLAHYLADAGVTNGDVVMIWAHRSVDLVIAMMGTLAAAGTISVLDPAYPPERQKIYLEVARPCALINIARATDESGPLAPTIRNYIDEELQLKTEVPSLRISDSGEVAGGLVDGVDVFTKVTSMAESPPNALVGPDSNPTLSFTSGSEGRPKAVLGRHFSLTRYFPWMAKKFELTSESRFTMLSGIAHDPIQRDVWTPIFLGAQLLIPSREDIQHEKLAEWMREHQPTVTHLTPAMGQILVGGASAEFPSLRSAFFVGDVLTTTDCRRLRALAANVNIINMMGTTETQRAVSWYRIPSRTLDPSLDLDKSFKDTIPAGQGMENVQLLVIDRQDRTKLCQVGEVGELYIRAAGLAEGYKGDQVLSDQKFLTNWFVDNQKWIDADREHPGEAWRKYYKGPRDRLYRTGDLGRYKDNDGNVECTGRADDQVKIRGFRIELNEIDSNLRQSSWIRDCKTLVRRDRNEEPTLVSYIVVEVGQWQQWLKDRQQDDVEDQGTVMGPTSVYMKRFRRMQAELRDHLKNRLPSYAVPTIYIFLNKLPLNPNGKVDKPNLPFPDIAEQKEDASTDEMQRWQGMTETERDVASLWATLIRGVNAKKIAPSNDFFDLGGHSLLAQQMLLDVRKSFGANITINTLYEFPELAGFSKQIDKRLHDANGTNGSTATVGEQTPAYTTSLTELTASLPRSYQTANPATMRASSQPTVFVTGATGFLGSYLLKDLLTRTSRAIRVIAHVRGAEDANFALERLHRSLQGYGLWKDSWSTRLSCVVGDLSKPNLGMDSQTWQRLSKEVDVVIHNGATVHWVRRYKDLRAANVQSTIDCMRLCTEGKAKIFTFVSSTSVLDTDHYVTLSDKSIATGQDAISEDDDLHGSSTGLGTGYGQTKWVSEQLVREAGRRGLCGSVVRPGYILGDSETGVCNTDDFLIRMLKGCIQLRARPRIINTVNSVPVNHVARVVVAAALNPLSSITSTDAGSTNGGVNVLQVTGHPRLRMNEFLSSLEWYGYLVPEVSYDTWKEELEKYVSAGPTEKDQEQHALMPLYHFCINDLPATTRAPELDDANAVKVLKADGENWTGEDESAGYGVSREDVGRYLRYLASIKFLSWPSGRGKPLPEVRMSHDLLKVVGAVGGRAASKQGRT